MFNPKIGRKVLFPLCALAIAASALSSQAQTYSASSNPIAPERPWIHQYDQTLTMKIMLATKAPGGGTQIANSLDKALEYVKQVDRLTLGIPKILYVVGWQYDGHDSKYPAFFEVNQGLKRPQDATALDSLKWFMQEARKYHTTVSVHINLRSVYPDSPLYDTYVQHDLIRRGSDGNFDKPDVHPHGFFDYKVCYTREWNAGFTQQRIDKLLQLLPIQEAGTVHIDAFVATAPCGGSQHVSLEQEIETQRKIYRYFRDRGIDVTGEKQGDDNTHWASFAGLEPMAMWLSESPKEYMERPASLLTGGWAKSSKDEPVRLAGNLFGSSFMGEDLFHTNTFSGFKGEFFTLTVPWYFLNQHKRLNAEIGAESTANFDGGVQSHVDSGGRITITQDGRTLRDGDDILMPASWVQGRALVGYSANGYGEKSWDLPPDWKGVSRVKVQEITVSGLHSMPPAPISDGKVVLHLGQDQAVLLQPLE